MIRFLFYVFLFFEIIAFFSCQLSEENLLSGQNFKLEFSKDTVFFDTIFSATKNWTQRLTVRNTEKNAIIIENISLLLGYNSPYSLSINGLEAKEFNNIKILGTDSLLILIKVFIPAQEREMPYLVGDQLLFSSKQKIPVLSYAQDANILTRPIIRQNTTWKKGKPYLIYDTLFVASNAKLTIEAGTEIRLASPYSSIGVAGTLVIQGTPSQIVKILGSRLDDNYKEQAGQWGSIIFAEGSKNNAIDYAQIKNGTTGIYLSTLDKDSIPDLVLEHSSISNMSEYGIFAYNSSVYAINNLIFNCGQSSVFSILGGKYTFLHNSIFHSNGAKDKASLIFTDYFDSSKQRITANLNVRMQNNIVWGGKDEEILFATVNKSAKLLVNHNILRTQQEFLQNNISKCPEFKNMSIFCNFMSSRYDFTLKNTSPAINSGAYLEILDDIEGKGRFGKPDLGAFEIK